MGPASRGDRSPVFYPGGRRSVLRNGSFPPVEARAGFSRLPRRVHEQPGGGAPGAPAVTSIIMIGLTLLGGAPMRRSNTAGIGTCSAGILRRARGVFCSGFFGSWGHSGWSAGAAAPSSLLGRRVNPTTITDAALHNVAAATKRLTHKGASQHTQEGAYGLLLARQRELVPPCSGNVRGSCRPFFVGCKQHLPDAAADL